MTNPNQNPNLVVPTVPPVIRIPADDASIQQTNAALAQLAALLGNPAQEGTIANVLEQLANFGAQPWVPNVQDAPILEAAPGTTTIITPGQAFRVWGGYVSMNVRSNNTYTGTDGFYAKVVVGNVSAPILVVAHVETGIAGANQHDSQSLYSGIPGAPMPANTPLKIDVNGGGGLGTTGVVRASANIFFSIP